MGFLGRLFAGKNRYYKSLYPDKVEGLTNDQKSFFDFIATQYKRLSLGDLKTSYLQQAFFDRYQRAREEGMKLDIFFQAEEEALNIYKKKLEISTKKSKQSLGPDLKSRQTMEKNTKINLITNYPRVLIHKKASADIERLYGALIAYEKKFASGLQQSIKLISESEFHEIVFAVIYGLEDFTHTKNKILPFIFSQYSFELEREMRDPKQLENEILTKLSIILDKVEKVILWGRRLNPTNITNNPFSKFSIGGDRLEFSEFFDALERDTQKLIKDFDLHSSTKY